MDTLTAAKLIEQAKSFQTADEARMCLRPEGVPRSVWRRDNPITIETSFMVRDTAYKSRPKRVVQVCLSPNIFEVMIHNATPGGKVIEWIDLRSPDADQRLARYEF